MADWNIAYNWMMDNEDALRTCEQVPDAPPGAFAIGGINSVTWPEAFAAVVALAQEKREPFVRQFHENHFWNMWHEQLESDEVSKRVFDFAVNGGSGSSVRCLQQALNHLSSPDQALLVDDGGWGPITLDAANRADQVALVEAFKAQRIAHYQAIVAADPGKRRFLAAWLARAEK
jgi:lysozyme family protein